MVSTNSQAFPELESERAELATARACRNQMIDRLERVDPQSSADAIKTSSAIRLAVRACYTSP